MHYTHRRTYRFNESNTTMLAEENDVYKHIRLLWNRLLAVKNIASCKIILGVARNFNTELNINI